MNLSDSQNLQQSIQLQIVVHTTNNFAFSKENYRPVSILTSLSEIFEKFMDNQLLEMKASDILDVHSGQAIVYSIYKRSVFKIIMHQLVKLTDAI